MRQKDRNPLPMIQVAPFPGLARLLLYVNQESTMEESTMGKQKRFAGDRKVGGSVLMAAEKRLVAAVVPRLPRGLETYHLTMLTVLWGLGVLGFALLARTNPWWFTGVSLMIAAQYLTDLFDGAVGRARDTGLVKWGFFMDHFLDFCFLETLIIGYAVIAPPGMQWWFMALMLLGGGLMVNSFLTFAATNRFEIYFNGFGPTEFRVLLITVNTLVCLTGTGHFPWTVPVVTVLFALGLAALTWRNHRVLWAMDMAEKAARRPALRRAA